ncbi:hypothetical protein PBS_43500 [Paraburkholderia sp. 2C]
MPAPVPFYLMNSIDPVLLMIAIAAAAVLLTVGAALIHQYYEAKHDRFADELRKRDLLKRFPDRQQ